MKRQIQRIIKEELEVKQGSMLPSCSAPEPGRLDALSSKAGSLYIHSVGSLDYLVLPVGDVDGYREDRNVTLPSISSRI